MLALVVITLFHCSKYLKFSIGDNVYPCISLDYKAETQFFDICATIVKILDHEKFLIKQLLLQFLAQIL